MPGQLFDDIAEEAVGITVTSRAFRSTHGDEVKVISLDEAFGDLYFNQFSLGDAARLIGAVFAALFPNLAHVLFDFHAKRQVKACVGIGINGKDRCMALVDKTGDQAACNGGLAATALSSNRYGIPGRQGSTSLLEMKDITDMPGEIFQHDKNHFSITQSERTGAA